ncbi:Concanavalin A-like lectin/glucanase [Cordyceps militaris CM01]|uniref:Concanavalin A-like lectin/glucanase n=1 Tax=Cordyceps militaris (strain CM01) TaxID=983644 RepID=G3JJS7_CORMM|nr:Concanavalin A-like lectin/glucanase [Cordyceps militaris CM01]EGX92111.1 Concanavalin A-like lectin/glucanase [Cordyceps militaris CM01]
MLSKLVSGLAALSLASLALSRPNSGYAIEGRSLEERSLEERAAVSSTIWCGPVLAAAARQVSAEWTIPRVTLPSPNVGQTAPMFYQWVGMDGVRASSCGSALLQAGTSQVWNGRAFVYDVWLEFYTPANTSSWHFTYPVVRPGDNVRTTVTAGSDSLSGTVLIENLTNRQSNTWNLRATGNYPLCFQNVEWINEAPTGKLPGFPNFSFNSLSYTDWNGRVSTATGANLWYINTSSAQCSATLSSDGRTASFTNAAPR